MPAQQRPYNFGQVYTQRLNAAYVPRNATMNMDPSFYGFGALPSQVTTDLPLDVAIGDPTYLAAQASGIPYGTLLAAASTNSAIAPPSNEEMAMLTIGSLALYFLVSTWYTKAK